MLYKSRPFGSISVGGRIANDFASLHRAMRGELEVYFGQKLPNPMEAEDYVQWAFERLVRYDKPLVEPENFLRVTASRLVKNAYRDAETQPRDLSWEELTGPNGTGLDHFPQFQTHENFAADFDSAVRGLDPEPRAAFILGELRGLPSRESAPLLGVSHATAAARRELATTEIRKELVHG